MRAFGGAAATEPGRWPTAREWVAQFLANDEAGRLAVAERAIENAQRAEQCFVTDHETEIASLHQTAARLMQENEALREELAEIGWQA